MEIRSTAQSRSVYSHHSRAAQQSHDDKTDPFRRQQACQDNTSAVTYE